MRRLLLISALFLGATAADPFTPAAEACPMCKAANETDSNLPRAYMLSILFMLGMPATLVAGFGLSFYRMSRNGTNERTFENSEYRGE
jgi:hypothetical protein